MKIVQPSVELVWVTPQPLETIEAAARTAYKSEDKIAPGTAAPFVARLLHQLHHESVIEHASLSMRFVCDRGVSHEIVRHRLFSFTQESTRYCNYASGKLGREITVIEPPDLTIHGRFVWASAVQEAEAAYLAMIAEGYTPQIARSVLPNSLKTEIVVTGNLREWRHFFKLRCAPSAHPQMQEVAKLAVRLAQEAVPVVFADLT